MLWNEPNNLSHWNFQLDPEWRRYARLVRLGAAAVRECAPELPVVAGGISPIDPQFARLLHSYGVLDEVDVLGIHGFPLDWNHWSIHDWPGKVAEIAAATHKPIWITEAGASSFGAEEVQVFGLEATARALLPEDANNGPRASSWSGADGPALHGTNHSPQPRRGVSKPPLASLQRAPQRAGEPEIAAADSGAKPERVYWYSLLDLPPSWTATTRHKESEGSAYYRHYYMGLVRADGTPKLAAERFPAGMGICQWFHFEDPRLNAAAQWLRRLGVRKLRTGLSWADWFRPRACEWFDRQMTALAEFDVTLTFCFTPTHLGIEPHYTSPPRRAEDFADFCRWAVGRYRAWADTPREACPVALGASRA